MNEKESILSVLMYLLLIILKLQNILRRTKPMKRQTLASKKIIPFCPNQKTRQYYIDKAVDYALAMVTSMGAVTVLLFFVLL